LPWTELSSQRRLSQTSATTLILSYECFGVISCYRTRVVRGQSTDVPWLLGSFNDLAIIGNIHT